MVGRIPTYIVYDNVTQCVGHQIRGEGAPGLWNIAFRLAADNPAEAERVMNMAPEQPGKSWFPPAIAWKMAQNDPARARRLVDESQRDRDEPQDYLSLALGLKTCDPAAADEAFRKAITLAPKKLIRTRRASEGSASEPSLARRVSMCKDAKLSCRGNMEGMDRLMKEGAEYSAMQGIRGVWLPLVEQIDSALVPEIFWRAVATRPPIGNPRSLFDESPSKLAMLLGWYDREVAAAVFEPVRAQMEQADNEDLAAVANPLQGWPTPFLGWSIFDPRAAVARLEQVPATAAISARAVFNSRVQVAQILGLSYKDRWRRIWTDYTDMRFLLERDIQ